VLEKSAGSAKRLGGVVDWWIYIMFPLGHTRAPHARPASEATNPMRTGARGQRAMIVLRGADIAGAMRGIGAFSYTGGLSIGRGCCTSRNGLTRVVSRGWPRRRNFAKAWS